MTKQECLDKAAAARVRAKKLRASAQASLDIAALPGCDRQFRPGHLKAAEQLVIDAEVEEAFAATCERWALEAA